MPGQLQDIFSAINDFKNTPPQVPNLPSPANFWNSEDMLDSNRRSSEALRYRDGASVWSNSGSKDLDQRLLRDNMSKSSMSQYQGNRASIDFTNKDTFQEVKTNSSHTEDRLHTGGVITHNPLFDLEPSPDALWNKAGSLAPNSTKRTFYSYQRNSHLSDTGTTPNMVC